MEEELYCCILCLNPDKYGKFDNISKMVGGCSIKGMLENIVGKKVNKDFT
jgi:hypothetical protein